MRRGRRSYSQLFFSLQTLLTRSVHRFHRTKSFPIIYIGKILEEALRDEFGDKIEPSFVAVKEAREDEIRIGIKNPLVAGEVFLRQAKILKRINNKLKGTRRIKRIRISL